MNAWLKRCVFNLDLSRESVSEPRTLSGRLFQSLGAKYEKCLPPLVDFAILGTTKSPEFYDLREQVGLQRDRRLVRYAGAQVLHSSLTHIDCKNGNYVRLLFIDYSSAFNTIVPIKLAVKLTDLCLNSSFCNWIQDFLTGRPQVVKVGQFTSNSITLNIGSPQGCVLSPLL